MNHTVKGLSLIALPFFAMFGMSQSAQAQSCTKLCDSDFWKDTDGAEIKSIIQSEEDINDADALGYSPLYFAAGFSEDPSVIKALVDAGADIGASVEGVTPLHSAAGNGKPQVVKALLDAGADLGARASDGWTPLHFAASYNADPQGVKTLLNSGADIGVRTEGGLTPLHLAAGSYNYMVVKALLDAGAALGARTDEGWTPLHVAATTSYTEVIKVLLDAGADISAQVDGWTPLHLTVRYNSNFGVLNDLLDAGADAKARTLQGKLPIDLVSENARLRQSQVLYKRLQDLSYN